MDERTEAAGNDPLLRVAQDHVRRRAIVVPEVRLLYLPVPKAGWTSMLWALAPLAGLTPQDFERSVKPEVLTVMAVHDETVWGRQGRLFSGLGAAEQDEVRAGDGWLRFSVVRDPARRLWSAWQSKLLLREPVYFGFHADRPWYPQLPRDAARVVDDFRAFVAAFDAGYATDTRMRDPHWGAQSDIVGLLPLDHVGRLERLTDTVAVVRAHLGSFAGVTGVAGAAEFEPGHDNTTLLPFSAALFDARTAAIVNRRYAADLASYGYAPVPEVDATDADLAAWARSAEPHLAHLHALVDRHERLRHVSVAFGRRLGSLQSERDDAQHRLSRTSESAAAARQEATSLRRERDRVATRLAAVQGSLSWRATAPLRRVSRSSAALRAVRRWASGRCSPSRTSRRTR